MSCHDVLAWTMHWTMAPLIAIQLGLGLLGERLDEPELARLLLEMHFQLGIVLLILLVLRIGWRLHARRHWRGPAGWRSGAATSLQLALYLVLFVLPASGYVMWVWMNETRGLFGIVQVPALFTPPAHDESGRALAWYVHVYGAYTLMVLVAMHAGAAIWHLRRRRQGFAAAS